MGIIRKKMAGLKEKYSQGHENVLSDTGAPLFICAVFLFHFFFFFFENLVVMSNDYITQTHCF